MNHRLMIELVNGLNCKCSSSDEDEERDILDIKEDEDEESSWNAHSICVINETIATAAVHSVLVFQ